MSTWIAVLGAVGMTVWVAWFWPTFFLREVGAFRRAAPRWARWLRAEYRPFALPALCVYYVPDIALHFRWWQVIFFAGNFYAWWVMRNDKDDDDDRWKKRRQKLASKVAEVAGRLQVVPAGAS